MLSVLEQFVSQAKGQELALERELQVLEDQMAPLATERDLSAERLRSLSERKQLLVTDQEQAVPPPDLSTLEATYKEEELRIRIAVNKLIEEQKAVRARYATEKAAAEKAKQLADKDIQDTKEAIEATEEDEAEEQKTLEGLERQLEDIEAHKLTVQQKLAEVRENNNKQAGEAVRIWQDGKETPPHRASPTREISVSPVIDTKRLKILDDDVADIVTEELMKGAWEEEDPSTENQPPLPPLSIFSPAATIPEELPPGEGRSPRINRSPPNYVMHEFVTGNKRKVMYGLDIRKTDTHILISDLPSIQTLREYGINYDVPIYEGRIECKVNVKPYAGKTTEYTDATKSKKPCVYCKGPVRAKTPMMKVTHTKGCTHICHPPCATYWTKGTDKMTVDCPDEKCKGKAH